MESFWRDFTVEVFHKGDPLYLIDIHDVTEEHAVRRAVSAVWMMALRDGREFEKDDLTGNIYTG